MVVRQTGTKIPAGRNRRLAERLRVSVEAKEIEGNYQPLQRGKPFNRFADEWLASLEVEDTTKRTYALHMIPRLRARGLGGTSRHHHLTTLSTALLAAEKMKYLARNPVSELKRGDWPKRTKTEAAYFRITEIDRLFVVLGDGLY